MKVLLAVAAAVASLAVVSAAAQVPEPPAAFYGAVTIDGEAPPPGTEVRAFIDGIDCTQPGGGGTIDAGDVGAYVIQVMHESQKAGCGESGKLITFTVGGREAGQTALWELDVRELSLNAGSGEPQPLPPDVSAPADAAASATAATSPTAVTQVPPTDDIDLPLTGRSPTPQPPGSAASGEDQDAGGDGPGLAGVAAMVLFAIAIVGGAAGWAMGRRSEGRRAGGGSGNEPG